MSGILLMMGGAKASPVAINDQNVFKGVADPADATSSYSIATDRKIKNQNGSNLEQWLESSANPADFEVRATFLSGDDTPSGNYGTWNNLGSTRTWSLTLTTVDTLHASIMIEIGYAGTATALDSCQVDFTSVVS